MDLYLFVLLNVSLPPTLAAESGVVSKLVSTFFSKADIPLVLFFMIQQTLSGFSDALSQANKTSFVASHHGDSSFL